MQEFAVYSVIPPEGCAAILWRDAEREGRGRRALKITAPDLLRAGHHRRDRPRAGRRRAHRHDAAAALLDSRWSRALAEVRRCVDDAAGRALREVPQDGPVGIIESRRTAVDRRRLSPQRCSAADLEGRALATRAAADARAARSACPPVIARLLCHRGLTDPDEASRFLAPTLGTCTIRSAGWPNAPAVDRLLARSPAASAS